LRLLIVVTTVGVAHSGKRAGMAFAGEPPGPGSGAPGAASLLPAHSASAGVPASAAPPPARTQPNIIFIMTDDQRFDSIAGVGPAYMPQDVMPNVEEQLMTSGIVFTQTLVTCPVCAPSRAAILSGGFYPRHTGVLTNEFPCGGAGRFYDGQTLGTLLQAQGYRTALLGKYINNSAELTGYDSHGQYIPSLRYVPPGWSAWLQSQSSNYIGQVYTFGSSSTGGPERGLYTPQDIRLPHQLSELDAFLEEQEARGFPASVSAVIRALYTRAGDYDHEGDIDWDDFKHLVPCLQGPGVSAGLACACFDADTDGDVDLADLATIQQGFGQMPYLTQSEEELALAFLEDAAERQVPFFLHITPYAPHDPAYPAPEDAQLWPGFEYRGRAWGEEDVSDKPWHLRGYVEPSFTRYYNHQTPFASGGRDPDEFFADMLRCVHAVDRMVGSICTALDQNPWLRDNTVVIFASDNGEMWGEHKRFSKGWPYEESIRVPLVVRMPGADPGVRDQLVAADLDVPATILHLAGYTEEEIAQTPLSNGTSLVRLVEDAQAPWRDSLVLEFFRLDTPTHATSWGAVRQQRWKYVLYDYIWSGVWVDELYDLQTDPYELASQHADPAWAELKGALAGLLAQERGLTIVGFVHPWGSAPAAKCGDPYSFQVQAVGGTPPYSWSEYLGNQNPQWTGLPPGLNLNADGSITGVPTTAGLFYFDIRVEDCSVSPHHGGPQVHIVRFETCISN